MSLTLPGFAAHAAPTPPDAHACKCGATMSYRATPQDEWQWGDELGRMTDEDHGLPDGFDNKWELLAELERRVWQSLERKRREKGSDFAPAEDAAAMQYSTLKAALDLGHNPFRHVHDPSPYTGRDWGIAPEAVPWCCDQPMWHRPSGWHCRERCGVVLIFG